MKLLLANSYFLENDLNEQKIMKPYPPLGLLYVASTMKEHGHEVELFDGTFRSPSDFKDSLASDKPDIVGIYANVITKEASLEMTRQAREAGLPVVLGGPDPSGDPDAYLEAGAHAVVCGEGELTFKELVSAIERDGLDADLTKIPGLALQGSGNGCVRTMKRDRIQDLDTLPHPARELIDMKGYVEAWRDRHGYSSISLITSRGCPYRCTWCSKEIFGFLFRQRSPQNVLEEIRWIIEEYKPDQLWFADDILSMKRSWVLELTQGMVREGLTIPFECLSRVDRVDREIVESLKEAGCFRIWYGAESGSDEIISNMKKDFTVAKVRESIKMTMDVGVQAGLFILMGYPGERLSHFLKTLGMIRDLSVHYCGGSVAFPIKGTQFYEDVKHLLAPGYSWSKRNENRLSFQGRYPRIFYWFAVRLLHNWASFFSVRTRKDGFVKQIVRSIKFSVAGAGLMVVGMAYDLKQKLFSGKTSKAAN